MTPAEKRALSLAATAWNRFRNDLRRGALIQAAVDAGTLAVRVDVALRIFRQR